jgi:hypothetical protein
MFFIMAVIIAGLLTALIIAVLFFIAPGLGGSILSFLFGDGIFLFWIWIACVILGYNAEEKRPEKEDDEIPEYLRYDRESYQRGYEGDKEYREMKISPKTSSSHATGASDGGVSGGDTDSGYYESGMDDSGLFGGDSSDASGDAGD